MRIANYFNTSKEDIDQKQFNVLIGISLGNKYFTENNIREYLLWAIENTNEKIAFLLPDKIHAINYEIKNRYSKERALEVSTRKSEELRNIIQEITEELPEIFRSRCVILNWKDIESSEYIRQREIFIEWFQKDDEFKKEVLQITKENINGKSLNDEDLEKLASYIINELPILLSGIEYMGNKYELLPYPGLSEIDYLVLDLQEKKKFIELCNKLNLKNKLRIIEAYVDDRSYYIGESANYGKTIYAIRDIKKNEVVFKVTGIKTDRPSIYTVPTSMHEFIDPFSPARNLNHSCNPSCGIKNNTEIVALRDIKKDEEITIDYAMIVKAYDSSRLKQDIHCNCGSRNCRGEFGSWDKLSEELKKEYWDWSSDYVKE